MMGLWTWHRAGVAAKHAKRTDRRLRAMARRPVPVRVVVRVLALPPRPDRSEP